MKKTATIYMRFG